MKNWKTTAMGLVTGFVGAAITGYQNGQFTLTWKSFVAFAIPTLWGLVQKDSDTTGIGANATKQQ